jgi:hypothetical protein
MAEEYGGVESWSKDIQKKHQMSRRTGVGKSVGLQFEPQQSKAWNARFMPRGSFWQAAELLSNERAAEALPLCPCRKSNPNVLMV